MVAGPDGLLDHWLLQWRSSYQSSPYVRSLSPRIRSLASHPERHPPLAHHRHSPKRHRSHRQTSLHADVSLGGLIGAVRSLGRLTSLWRADPSLPFGKGSWKQTISQAPGREPRDQEDGGFGYTPFLTLNLYPLVHSLLLEAHRPQTGVTRSPGSQITNFVSHLRSRQRHAHPICEVGLGTVNEGTGEGNGKFRGMLESTAREPSCPRANPPEWIWLEPTLEMLSSTTLAVVVQGKGSADLHVIRIRWNADMDECIATSSGTRMRRLTTRLVQRRVRADWTDWVRASQWTFCDKEQQHQRRC